MSIAIQPDLPTTPTASNPKFELGLYSFAELTPDAHTGKMISPAQRLHNLLETIELVEQVGLDVFALGEAPTLFLHHLL